MLEAPSTEAPSLDGPRLEPASGNPARALVVLLHGYGADGNDLIDIGRAVAPHLADAAFVSPHAPHPCGMAPTGREWFPLTMRDPEEYARGADAARPALDAFLDAELARLELTDDRLLLVGFSQGTMMALHTGLRRPKPPAGIIGFSGLLPGPETLEAEMNKTPPPVLLVHGDADEVVPVQASEVAQRMLALLGVEARYEPRPGLGHGIDPAGLTTALEFAQDALSI